jgi:hypothetical protein
MTSLPLPAGPPEPDDGEVEAVPEPGTPLGPIDSIWLVREPLNARLVSATWRHQGDAELPARTRLRYVEFSSIYDRCFGYDWAWHFFRILDGPATGRRMVLYSDCFAPPHDRVEPVD